MTRDQADTFAEILQKSGRGLPHSKTWRKQGWASDVAKRLGVRRPSVAFVCVILCGLLSASLCPAAAPTVCERRVINNYQVDLTPLFVWWDHREHHHGMRPLTSWKHLKGALERETVYGWLVRGYIEGQSDLQYFLLKNPPRNELARYRELEAELPKLEHARAETLPNTKLPVDRAAEWLAWGVPSEEINRVENARTDLNQIDQKIQTSREEMSGMLTKLGYFKVDVFALQLNQVYQGNPVFDFGYPPY
jgi:hypothetical protein